MTKQAVTKPKGRKSLSGLTIQMREARNDIVDCLNDPHLINPTRRLFELAASGDENIALTASIALSRLYTRPLAPSEERHSIQLDNQYETLDDLKGASRSITAAIAGGHLPEKQGQLLLKSVNQQIEIHRLLHIQTRLDALEENEQVEREIQRGGAPISYNIIGDPTEPTERGH